ncbi:MAG: chorismate-binding protein [Microthrixaceae bacterium]
MAALRSPRCRQPSAICGRGAAAGDRRRGGERAPGAVPGPRRSRVWSSPIKGTASSPDGFLDKDRAENLMIVDLVRNDLGRVCEWGSVSVPSLFSLEEHPGLFHLVSTVEGRLRPGTGWSETIRATFPPGSVTGALKIAALEVIGELEPEPRGPYCGAIGWVDAETRRGELNVAIRTFWMAEGELNFGTGGAITWESDADWEWDETELKAANLLRVIPPGPDRTRTLTPMRARHSE